MVFTRRSLNSVHNNVAATFFVLTSLTQSLHALNALRWWILCVFFCTGRSAAGKLLMNIAQRNKRFVNVMFSPTYIHMLVGAKQNIIILRGDTKNTFCAMWNSSRARQYMLVMLLLTWQLTILQRQSSLNASVRANIWRLKRQCSWRQRRRHFNARPPQYKCYRTTTKRPASLCTVRDVAMLVVVVVVFYSKLNLMCWALNCMYLFGIYYIYATNMQPNVYILHSVTGFCIQPHTKPTPRY